MVVKEVIDFMENARTRLQIDEFSLEDECKKQPLFYAEVGDLYVAVKSLAKKARNFLDLKHAEIEKRIRSNPEAFGLIGKTTETCIASTILLQDEYLKAKDDLLQTELDADGLQILLVAAEQRKSMLRDLVTLFVYKYYSSDEFKGENRKLSEVTEDKITELRRKRAEQKKEGRENS